MRSGRSATTPLAGAPSDWQWARAVGVGYSSASTSRRPGISPTARGSGDRSHIDSARVLDLWERVLKAVDTDDLDSVATEIDWVIKQRLLQRYMDKHDLTLPSPRIAQLDLAYHDISRERGLFYLLERRGMAARITHEPEVFEAKTRPAIDDSGQAAR